MPPQLWVVQTAPSSNHKGKVIGVNAAILRDFGGSNLAVLVRYADELLK
jgi:S1-C subfamily serine protease